MKAAVNIKANLIELATGDVTSDKIENKIKEIEKALLNFIKQAENNEIYINKFQTVLNNIVFSYEENNKIYSLKLFEINEYYDLFLTSGITTDVHIEEYVKPYSSKVSKKFGNSKENQGFQAIDLQIEIIGNKILLINAKDNENFCTISIKENNGWFKNSIQVKEEFIDENFYKLRKKFFYKKRELTKEEKVQKAGLWLLFFLVMFLIVSLSINY